MSKFSMTCSCGTVVGPVDAATREEAVGMIKGLMNEGAIAAHMAEKHAGEPVPPVSQVHAQIEQGTVAA